MASGNTTVSTVHAESEHRVEYSLDDFTAMLERSNAAGVKSMIITGGSLHESKKALDLAKKHGGYLYYSLNPTPLKLVPF